MCCFSGRQVALQVSNTRIYAQRRGGRQLLVYEMRLATREPVAMVLPLHVAPGTGEDALRFVDLSGYPGLFDDLDRAFAPPPSRGPPPQAPGPASAGRLRVEKVGAFEASYVPSLADFGRLDPRFRIDDSLWGRLPGYAAAGFAVFQLAAGEQRVHPMALEYPARWPECLYFPTVHIHDGELPARAVFDHSLYFQGFDEVVLGDRTFGARGEGEVTFRRVQGTYSPRAIGACVDESRAAGLFDPQMHGFRLRAAGELRNDDTWIVPIDDEPRTGCTGFGVSAWSPV